MARPFAALVFCLAINTFVCGVTARAAETTSAVTIEVAGSRLRIEPRGDPPVAANAELTEWVRRSAAIVSRYYGYFPLDAVTVRITIVDGTRVITGHANAWPQPVIDVAVGRQVKAAALQGDWILVHEMIHLALPDVGEEHSWLAEGLATYVEGVARVQAGNMTVESLWSEYVAQMPKGLPSATDRGLDHTHTWGRTYWGGALFCLQSDVRILSETRGRLGLRDALRAIGHQSGGMRSDWPIAKVLYLGDEATGTHVLSSLYLAMRDSATAPDLSTLWQQLGIEIHGDQLRFTDAAPLAAVRRSITAP
jgi:hypothetical protein